MREDFGHRLPLTQIRDGDRVELCADEAEREAIAKRLGLLSLDRLEANLALERDGPRILVRGRIRAALEQSCVATGEAVAEAVDEPFEIQFVPEPHPQSAEEEVELRAEECDTVFYEGEAIDLGSAVADTLALSVDPYPRTAGAQAALKEAGVLSEAEAGPFGVLAQLKGKSEG